MNAVLLLTLLPTATIWPQEPIREHQRPELAMVFGIKIRNEYQYITAAGESYKGDQTGQVTVDFPTVSMDSLTLNFSLPTDTWSDTSTRGYDVEFSLADTEYSITRTPITYLTYPVENSLLQQHNVYEQLGGDVFNWDKEPVFNWTVRGPETTISGSDGLGPPAPNSITAIYYRPEIMSLVPNTSVWYQERVWSGVLDDLPIEVWTTAIVSHELIPEPSSIVLAGIGCLGLLLVARRARRCRTV